MDTFEIDLKCTDCQWTGKQTKEHTEPLDSNQKFLSLINTSLSTKCPDCGGPVISVTKLI